MPKKKSELKDMTDVEGLNFKRFMPRSIPKQAIQMPHDFQVTTLEGVQTGSKGDWLMVGVNGERYICKDEVFQKTYFPIES